MSPAPKPSPKALSDGPSSDPLLKDALAWIVRLHSGDETEADRAAFESWKATSGKHAAAAGRAEMLWSSLRPTLKRYRGTRRRLSALILVAPLGMALAALAVLRPLPYAELLADYRTTTGEVRTVALADGSVVELDTGTSFDVGDGGRTLKLYAGQIFVRVAPDPSRPFRVVTEKAETRALGTAFAIRVVGNRERVVVTEHAVRVTEEASRRSVDLGEGEALEICPRRSVKPYKADLDALLAWRNGGLRFRDARFGAVVAEVGRYRYGRIMVLDDEVRKLRITGNFDIGDTDAFLTAASVSLPVRIVRLPGLVLISRDRSRPLPAR